MKIATNVEMLEVKSQGAYYPVLLWDEKDVVLIDTGFPGQFELIKEEMAKCGFMPEQVTKVFLTHQDIDHVGSVGIFRALGAKIYAYETEAPYIEGVKPLVKLAAMEGHLDELPPDRLAFYHMLKKNMPQLQTHVDKTLVDGQNVPVCGGIQVIHTPGHTPGHMALLLLGAGIVVCGDAANINGGALIGANPVHTPDMEVAAGSFEKLKTLDVTGYVCYHGGYLVK